MTDWEMIRRRMADTAWRDEIEAEVLCRWPELAGSLLHFHDTQRAWVALNNLGGTWLIDHDNPNSEGLSQ